MWGMLITLVLAVMLVSIGWFEYRGPSKVDIVEEVGTTSPLGVVDYARGVVDNATQKTNQGIEDTLSDAPAVSTAHSLNLSGQGLTKVPDSTFSRTELELLDVSHNNLTGALQAEVRQLSNLKVLDISDNQFTGVPAEVGQLSKLEILDLSNNQLTGLPYELGNLSHLKILDLRGNNYATQDLEVIKQKLPASTVIKTE